MLFVVLNVMCLANQTSPLGSQLSALGRTLTFTRTAKLSESYVFWTVHHFDSWVKRDQLDVTCFIISLFNAQHVSDVNTSILRSLRYIHPQELATYFLSYFMGCIALVRYVLVLRCGLAWVVWYPYAGWGTSASVCIRIPHHHSHTTT